MPDRGSRWMGIKSPRLAGVQAGPSLSTSCVLALLTSYASMTSLNQASDIQADSSLPPLKALAVSYAPTDFVYAEAKLEDFDRLKEDTPALREAYDELMAEPCSTAWSPVPLGPPL